MAKFNKEKINPYCLRRWSEVMQYIDMDNLDILDKILFKTKELRELGINNFQTWGKPNKFLNPVFGLKGSTYNDDYGIQSVWISGFDFGNLSAIVPRVHIEYRKGRWQDTYHVYIGEERIPENRTKRSYDRHFYRKATQEEIDGVYDYICSLIDERLAEIEKQKENPSFEEFANKCLEYAQKCVESEDNTYHAQLTKGKCLNDSTETMAVVIEKKKLTPGYEMFGQAGHIKIMQNKHGEFSLEVRAPLAGGYSSVLEDWHDYEKIIKDGVYYIMN